ncbi:UDP-N-acetylmuramate--L-alanine ligase [hydrothermal vent metagenome]|uniref:UDP-N-acetylmuramate--L-alanine ligase n=1 Tax=hydrothermal vent metagenome TaxID=652676 RepID=A0A3B0VI96_9ZZZZ
MYHKNKRIHFVGIGGIGMSGIAELLLNLGYKVSGSDLRESDITRHLTAAGAKVHIGHRAAWIAGAEVVVISSAIRDDNPEVAAAHKEKIPVIPRAEMLAELMRLKKYGIAVAGSHGKTSTTSLTGWLLAQADFDPTVVIGGLVNSMDSNAKLGSGEFMVAEADESDGSFLHLAPVIEIVTNIDLEHLDFYHDIEEIKAVFMEFIHKIPFYGAVVLCLDNDNIASLLPQIKKRVITYGLSAQADIHARDIVTKGLNSSFELCRGHEVLGTINLPLAGTHNVYNSLAAMAVAMELGVSFELIRGALADYSGVQRRLQIKGEAAGITVIDDYGHHPTEIRATLRALREAWPKRRLVVIFQPHRYSRTQGLFKEFCTAFHQADMLFMTNIYPADEDPIAGVSSEALLEQIRAHGQKGVHFVAEVDEAAAQVIPFLRAGDVVLTLGAGSIWRAGEQVLAAIKGEGGTE